MTANVESMFSVREVPWHGLGTIVSSAPNSTEAINIAVTPIRSVISLITIFHKTRIWKIICLML